MSANPQFWTKAGVEAQLATKQANITSTAKLSADLVDDTSTTNKFITAAQASAIDANTAKVSCTDATVGGFGYTKNAGTVTSASAGGQTASTVTSGNLDVSPLFSSNNTSYDAANINYTATGETATTVKAKIQAIETQVGTAAASLTTALGTAAS